MLSSRAEILASLLGAPTVLVELTDVDDLEVKVGQTLNAPHRTEVPIAKGDQNAVDSQLRRIDPGDRC